MLYIASDHGGFKLKEEIKKFLKQEKVEFSDLGPNTFKQDDDYPDYAKLVAKKVSKNPPSLPGEKTKAGDLGILLCRSGQGVCIVANKFKNVRAALVWNHGEAKVSRNDDMSNILCLPSDYVSPSAAKRIVEQWLESSYSSDKRHLRRVKKINQL